MSGVILRPGRDADAEGFIRLIGDCWSEYPGCLMDVDGEVPELRALATYFAEARGALWAAEQDGRVIGMAAVRPMGQDAAYEICKVYLAKEARGTGLAHTLLDAAEMHARAAGAQRLVLWSDTRFATAHRFYEKRGFVRQGSIRVLDDISQSLEFRYVKPIAGLVVEVLDAAAAASAERRLSALLADSVAEGAGLGWFAPLAPAVAQGVWRGVSARVALGKAVLLVAWLEGKVAGAALLSLDRPETQPHRADLQMLIVAPAARRRGVGRALLSRAEQAARNIGRSLLVLEAPASSPAEAMFRAAGWTELGTLPGGTLGPDRQPVGIVQFWKRLAA